MGIFDRLRNRMETREERERERLKASLEKLERREKTAKLKAQVREKQENIRKLEGPSRFERLRGIGSKLQSLDKAIGDIGALDIEPSIDMDEALYGKKRRRRR